MKSPLKVLRTLWICIVIVLNIYRPDAFIFINQWTDITRVEVITEVFKPLPKYSTVMTHVNEIFYYETLYQFIWLYHGYLYYISTLRPILITVNWVMRLYHLNSQNLLWNITPSILVFFFKKSDTLAKSRSTSQSWKSTSNPGEQIPRCV